jgi:hypothetical protein
MIDKPPENIAYFYAKYQDTFGEIQNLVPGIKFVQGLPDDILDSINPETRNLYVIDDFMGEKDGVISKLFTKKSHHGNLPECDLHCTSLNQTTNHSKPTLIPLLYHTRGGTLKNA